MFKDYKKLFIFDTETTGFSAENDDVIEFGGLLLEKNENGRFVETKAISELIKTDKTILNSHIHHITNEMCESNGITPQELFDQIKGILGTDKEVLLIAHNISFDMKMMEAFMKRIDKDYKITSDQLDTMEIAQNRIGQRKGSKLCDMLVRYSITDFENSHRALDDVRATLAVLRAFYKEKDDIEQYIKRS